VVQVQYNTEGWLIKNKDPLNDNVTEQLTKSTNEYIATLWGGAFGPLPAAILAVFGCCPFDTSLLDISLTPCLFISC